MKKSRRQAKTDTGITSRTDVRSAARFVESETGEETPLADSLHKRSAWGRFWFTPTDPIALHLFRVLSGLLILGWLLTMLGQQGSFFGLRGWFDVQAYRDAARLPFGQPVPFGWSILYLCGESTTLLNIVYGASLLVILLFTFGIAVRITAVLTWVIVVSFLANPAIRFGADYMLVIFAFYLMLGYLFYGQLNGRNKWWERILGPLDAIPFVGRLLGSSERQDIPRMSYAANMTIRLVQVHFAVVVVTSCLHKFQMAAWWGGTALWYPLHPPLTTSFDAINVYPNLYVANIYLFWWSLIQYGVLAWQLTFPLFAWRGGWQRILSVGSGVIGWLGCIFVLGLPLFGPVWLLGCLSYVHPREWRSLMSLGARPTEEEPRKQRESSRRNLAKAATA